MGVYSLNSRYSKEGSAEMAIWWAIIAIRFGLFSDHFFKFIISIYSFKK